MADQELTAKNEAQQKKEQPYRIRQDQDMTVPRLDLLPDNQEGQSDACQQAERKPAGSQHFFPFPLQTGPERQDLQQQKRLEHQDIGHGRSHG